MIGRRLVGAGAVVLASVLSSCAGTGPAATRSTPTVDRGPVSPAVTSPAPRTFSDIPYATASPAERLDIHLPPGAGPFPVVVYVHGGAWMTGDKAAPEYLSGVPFLLRRGYAVVLINYRLTPEAIFPAQIQDVKAAVRWVRANAAVYRLDPDRIAAWGDSSGGHLVALLGTSAGVARFDDPKLGNPGVSSAVLAVIDWYGPVNFLTMDRQLARDGMTSAESHDAATSGESRLVGAPIQTVPGRVRAANPVTYLTTGRKVPPFLIEHGDRDDVVPFQQSVGLFNALVRHGGPHAAGLRIVKGSGHWMDFDAASQLPVALAFLDRVLGN
jgi:acetyl esterase/lipase